MEFRKLGASDLKVPVLCFGTATFGSGEGFEAWGSNGVQAATRMVDLCLDAGVTMFDSADIYSAGQAEEILGQAIKGRRDKVIISTKGTFRFSDEPDDIGSGRKHLTKQIEGSLRPAGRRGVGSGTMCGGGPGRGVVAQRGGASLGAPLRPRWARRLGSRVL
jgi:aryl-alcohol dehydrogenase-like predicted oxidoreductase